MHSRLSHTLIPHLDQFNSFVPDVIYGNHTPKKGAYNIIRFGVLANSCTSEKIALTIIRKKYEDDDRVIKPSNAAIDLLKRKEVDTTFIHQYLFRSDRGEKLARKANCDFGDFYDQQNEAIRKDEKRVIATPEQIKDLVVQLVLAINALHEKRLVHRDIKLKNILLFMRGDKIHLKLADLDSIIVEGDRKARFSGTYGCMPKWVWRIHEPLYQTRRVDCYALGRILNMLCEFYWNHNQANDFAKMGDLSDKLLDNPTFTIDRAIQHPYFGETKEKRMDLFCRVKQHYQQFSDFHHYIPRHGIVNVNDPFYVMPYHLQEMYVSLNNLFNKLYFLDNIQRNSLKRIFTKVENSILQNDIRTISKKLETEKYEDAPFNLPALKKTLKMIEQKFEESSAKRKITFAEQCSVMVIENSIKGNRNMPHAKDETNHVKTVPGHKKTENGAKNHAEQHPGVLPSLRYAKGKFLLMSVSERMSESPVNISSLAFTGPYGPTIKKRR